MGAEPITARIRAIGPGPVHIIQLTIDAPSFCFAAGQYLSVVHPNGERIPFSIATPPENLPNLELHFQPTPGNPHTDLMREILSHSTLLFEGPSGDTTLNKATHTDLLFVCAGSGFAQAAAMIEAARLDSRFQSITLLWCCETATSFYAARRFYDLGPRVSKHLCIDANRSEHNAGMTWLKRHAAELRADSDLFLCGSPGFVWAVSDLLEANGIAAPRLHSDVYAYAPRR